MLEKMTEDYPYQVWKTYRLTYHKYVTAIEHCWPETLAANAELASAVKAVYDAEKKIDEIMFDLIEKRPDHKAEYWEE